MSNKTLSKQETLITGVVDIVFMAAKNPIKNQKSGKEEYGVGIVLDLTDTNNAAFLKRVDEINATKTSKLRHKVENGKVRLSFSSTIQPVVFDKDGNTTEAPFFMGKATDEHPADSATGVITVKAITYQGSETLLRLSSILLKNTNIAERTQTVKPTVSEAELRAMVSRK